MAETVETTIETNTRESPVFDYQFLDDNPDFTSVRLAARIEAREIVDTNREQLRYGNFGAVAMPVDALGTARRVNDTIAIYGQNSPEYLERFEGLVLDCGRLLGEAARKNSFEYFPLQRQEFNPYDNQYYSHGMQILEMTSLGLTPLAEPEEVEIRINDRVEEISYGLGRIALADAARIRTISECPDWAIQAYESGSANHFGGYDPENRKIMIRDVSYDTETQDRFQEQIGVSGNYITHEVIVETLDRRGLDATSKNKIELHGSQIEAHDDLLDFVALLDKVASEKSGNRIFMGEKIRDTDIVDYSAVRENAKARQEKLVIKSLELASTVLELESNNVDSWAAVGIVESNVKHMLFELAKTDSTVAINAFNETTARGLQDVAFLQLLGRYDEADLMMKEVEKSAPAPSYCGAGSCGLESLGSGTEAGQIAQDLGLDASNGLIKDTERSCVKCSKKSVVYDMKGKKGCTSCGATAKYK